MGKLIHNLSKWCNGNSILVVTVSGILTRLYCPFEVECVESVGNKIKGETYIVTKVGAWNGRNLGYQIDNEYYPYFMFRLR